jgi:hypothetical protein
MIPDLVTFVRKVLVQEAIDERIPDFRSFVRVEVGLRLLEVLGLSNEPPIAIWALLQAHELPAIKALCLNDYQRRYLANFRAVTHQYSENDWLENIEAYVDLPEDVRVYQVALAEKRVREALYAPGGRNSASGVTTKSWRSGSNIAPRRRTRSKRIRLICIESLMGNMLRSVFQKPFCRPPKQTAARFP